jgi:hypothetical protein
MSLGCGVHTAAVHWRGGARKLIDLPSISSGQWDRRVDEISEATVTVEKGRAASACSAELGSITPFAHELTVYRDAEPVWQGPISKVTETRTTVTVDARDVLYYLDARVNSETYSFTGAAAMDLSLIAGWLIRNGLHRDDPNVEQWLQITESGIIGERAAYAQSVVILDELAELGRNGLDFTTVGRRIIVAPELGPLVPVRARLTDADFLGDLEVEVSGDDAGTRWIVEGAATETDTGESGEPLRGVAGGVDPFLGLVERIAREDSILDQSSAAVSAQRRVAVSNPAPVYLRVPQGAQLAPAAPVSVQQLVAGIGVNVAVEDMLRRVRSTQRLIRVTAGWSEAGEAIGVTLAPFGSEEST